MWSEFAACRRAFASSIASPDSSGTSFSWCATGVSPCQSLLFLNTTEQRPVRLSMAFRMLSGGRKPSWFPGRSDIPPRCMVGYWRFSLPPPDGLRYRLFFSLLRKVLRRPACYVSDSSRRSRLLSFVSRCIHANSPLFFPGKAELNKSPVPSWMRFPGIIDNIPSRKWVVL